MGGVCTCAVPKSDNLLKQHAILHRTKVQASSSNMAVDVTKVAIVNDKQSAESQKEIGILKDERLKSKAFVICHEEQELDENGEHYGFIVFLEKYLSLPIIEKLFTKMNIECITNQKELTQILKISIALYRAHVFRVKNNVFAVSNERTTFKKCDIEPVAKYLSAWIVNEYGQSDQIQMSQSEFRDHLHIYLRNFLKSKLKWKSCYSVMSLDLAFSE